MSGTELQIEVEAEPEDRYSRLTQGGISRETLSSARVLVAGAGALGNEVIKNLVLLGIGSLLIVDFDSIEVTNLSRSVLFRQTDLGRAKAEVAAQRAKEINPDVEVAWFDGDVGADLGTGVFRRMNAVIACLDSRAARLVVNRHCWLAQQPWIDGALRGFDGLVRLFGPAQPPCYECTLVAADYAELRLRQSCQGIVQDGGAKEVIPTTPTSAALVAAMQVEHALRLLHGQPVPFGCEIIYSSALSELLRVQLREKNDCLSHETADPLVELHGAQARTTALGDLLAEARHLLGPGATLELDREIATHLLCVECGRLEACIAPVFRLGPQAVACPRCRHERTILSVHRIDEQTSFLHVTLDELGIPPGHIVRARRNDAYCYLELSGDFPTALQPHPIDPV